eukprot:CAMPEP_0176442416 /NCGR_PEP_ID=MMETSP0127-20121128/21799_1 /TAXON_ID=938130 /ORGANISM="Platyophrya macrostoma, Strain WH" /LENGTH=491 /DNA_ID=CAMNT_0017827419 /DNA_START=110 /DNA_END=1585 /DNA_ORIENTATION=-
MSQIELEKGYVASRVYQDKSMGELVNQIIVNTAVQSPLLVDNSDLMYNATKTILGKTLSGFLVKKTVGRVFTGGSTFEDVLVPTKAYNQRGIPVFLDYVAEATAEHIPTEEEMDYFTECFCKSAEIAAQHKGNGISIKFTALVDYNTLKKTNAVQQQFLDFFDDAVNHNAEAKEASLEALFNAMKKKNPNLEKQAFLDYIKQIFRRDVNDITADQKISRFDWRLNTHIFNISPEMGHVSPLVQSFAKLDDRDMKEMKRFTERLDKIFSTSRKLNVEVLCDAEQTYVQAMIDSITEQFGFKYNNDTPIVINTVQNYLKASKSRVLFEVEKCEKLKQPFALKMVRGAYMVEENRLAKEAGRPSPILESLQQTHNNYDSNLEYLMNKLDKKSQIYVCSHNEQSILKTIDMIESKGISRSNGGVKFAQLMGLGEHLTIYLHTMGFNVYKYIAFGPTDIMMPFLIRRAQESRQMLAGSRLQGKLLKKELKSRFLNK